MNTTDFPNGLYFLIVEAQQQRVLERQFVVEHRR